MDDEDRLKIIEKMRRYIPQRYLQHVLHQVFLQFSWTPISLGQPLKVTHILTARLNVAPATFRIFFNTIM